MAKRVKSDNGKFYGVFSNPSGEAQHQNFTMEEAAKACCKLNNSFGHGTRYDMFYVSSHDYMADPFGWATPHTAPDATWGRRAA